MKRQIIVCLTAMILTTPFASAQIDLHCHMIPDSYLEAIKTHGMEMDEGFPIPAWDAEEHLKFMDEAGIQTSVLTMPAPALIGAKKALEGRLAAHGLAPEDILTNNAKSLFNLQ